MEMSFQLYSGRNFQPWPKQLAALSAYGYTQVEGYGDVFANPAEFAADLDNAGLKMPSGHFSIDILENDFNKALEIIKTLGISQVYCPYLEAENRPTDVLGWQDFARRLGVIGDKLASNGISFGWHNHDFEFAALADGQIPMAILLDAAPNISWEADIAWIVVGGQDPFDWIEKYGDRITAIHLKDRAPEGENIDQDGWCDVGAGTINWSALLDSVKSKTNTTIYAVEHDNPADAFSFAKNSIENIKSY